MQTTPNNKRNAPNQRGHRASFNSTGSPQCATSTPPPAQKPKRRVVPISLSTGAAGSNSSVSTATFSGTNTVAKSFNSPAFCSDNNLVGIGEDADMSRDMLRTHKAAIVRDFQESSSNVAASSAVPVVEPEGVCIDLQLVTARPLLTKVAAIYAALLEQPVTAMHSLNEIAYLLNLLNAKYALLLQPCDEMGSGAAEPAGDYVAQLFRNPHNCVCFGIDVLRRQQHVLIVLDLATLQVLLQNERLLQLADAPLAARLQRVYDRRLHRKTLSADAAAPNDVPTANAALLNVSYQQDIDTKPNFPTLREFGAFNKQRDQFYAILRVWQAQHYIPSWSASAELGAKVLALLRIDEHPVTMHHLAKLFVSQLLLTATFDVSGAADLHALLPNTDASKLSKLQQRLHAPSQFSTDYTFPGQQAFFREFLQLAAYHHVFVVQLRIVLIAELLELNDSTYEALNVSAVAAEPLNDSHTPEYAVRADAIIKMRVLARFIGLLTAQPHEYAGLRCPEVDQRQVLLRNQTVPDFDVQRILVRSVLGHRLLVVVPWLVQYLAMLDVVTLRLAYFGELLALLAELQSWCADGRLPVARTSQFIVQSCVGWLFDQPQVPAEYQSFRHSADRQQRTGTLAASLMRGAGRRMHAVQVLVPADMMVELGATDDCAVLTVTGVSADVAGQLQCTLRRMDVANTVAADESHPVCAKPLTERLDDLEATLAAIEPMEDILTAACPFLADFRVSIMPPKTLSKTISRSGRYRHITTKTAELSAGPTAGSPAGSQTPAAAQPQNSQTVLAEAFLHSQSLSVRRTVDFCTERTVSAVIKDFQVERIVPMRAQVVALLHSRAAACADLDDARRTLHEAYTAALRELRVQWSQHMHAAIADRAERALDALLPNETTTAVRQVCVGMVKRRAAAKTEDWAAANFAGIGE